jgi:UDP-N-acetylglucosamine:LPS N-acetylglucosamine transferase
MIRGVWEVPSRTGFQHDGVARTSRATAGGGDNASSMSKHHKAPSSRPTRLGLVGSSGGHLAQLMALRPVWEHYDRFWVTFATADALSLLRGERVYWCYHPTNRNAVNLVRNTLLAARVLARENPTHLLSTGAAVAVPFFYVGRAMGASPFYIEVFDRIDSPTLTGRLVRPIVDEFFVQWPEQLDLYPGATLLGPVL